MLESARLCTSLAFHEAGIPRRTSAHPFALPERIALRPAGSGPSGQCGRTSAHDRATPPSATNLNSGFYRSSSARKCGHASAKSLFTLTANTPLPADQGSRRTALPFSLHFPLPAVTWTLTSKSLVSATITPGLNMPTSLVLTQDELSR